LHLENPSHALAKGTGRGAGKLHRLTPCDDHDGQLGVGRDPIDGVVQKGLHLASAVLEGRRLRAPVL
jgi:hypothetical protein